MAGTVDLVQRGYTGLRVQGDALILDPVIPPELGHLTSRIRFRGHWLEIAISTSEARVSLEPGSDEPISVQIDSTTAILDPGESLTIELP